MSDLGIINDSNRSRAVMVKTFVTTGLQDAIGHHFEMCIRDRQQGTFLLGPLAHEPCGREQVIRSSGRRICGERQHPGLNAQPVSYTHLDVYKRQVTASPAMMPQKWAMTMVRKHHRNR